LKTLYIHGLDSHPVPEKLEILKNSGLDVVALHIDYRKDKGVYEKLKSTIQSEMVEFIVGSSMGGVIGYWLAEDLGLPCLLFNPAMSYLGELKPHMPAIDHHTCPARFVVIGAHDKSVDPQGNIIFFRNIERADCFQRVIVCEWLTHQIDFNTFEEMVGWALKSYLLFNVKQ
jgi:hypothetical protein